MAKTELLSVVFGKHLPPPSQGLSGEPWSNCAPR